MDADDSQSTASDSMDASILTVIENNQSQEVDSTSAFTSVTALSENLVNTDYDHTPIQSVEPASKQPVEPVIGLTTEEQRCKEEDSKLTINELLGLSSCEDHVSTSLQTLDGQYMDHYYASVIKTLVEIIKCSATDCQIVLVNMARALKYLEDFGQRQSQLFKVLEKYHLLPDNLENLQSQFGFLK